MKEKFLLIWDVIIRLAKIFTKVDELLGLIKDWFKDDNDVDD